MTKDASEYTGIWDRGDAGMTNIEQVRGEIKEAVRNFRVLDDIDNTSYMAGINKERNLDDVTTNIISLLQPLIDQARAEGRREVIDEVMEGGITLHLEAMDGEPVAMFNDGDCFPQTGELASFLMHISVMIPTWNTDDKLLIIPQQALKG